MLAGLNNVSFEFGAHTIVKNATWHIHAGERIGLVGYNGAGKTTLLKILVGEYQPSSGSVERSKTTTIGYLHQDMLSLNTNATILEVALSAFEKVQQLDSEIKQLEIALHNNSTEKLLEEYMLKLHELELAGGYHIHHITEEVLQGLGFNNADFQRPFQQLSGGWRMRVLLARMILQQPDILMLDEPTNHLDLPSIEWLEKYLQQYKGSVIIISHDKTFLNRMVHKIVELYQQQLYFYSGNYNFYEQEKQLRVEQQQRAYENQQEYIRQQERFIERFRSKATKAAAAQSAIKRLDKLERVEQVEVERPDLKINFQIDKQPGKIIFTLKEATKQFNEHIILNHAFAEMNRGDKIALIGANGKGKSTLLRIIAGTEPFDGMFINGYNVVQSFYAQHQLESLQLQNSVLEEMQTCGSGKTEQELRNLLGCFLFSGEDVDKKIKVLSGGEKARVALAKVIAGKANFLLLDEPTNHLDIVSTELLAEALKQYEGSFIAVSHDRYFISKIANKIWQIEDGKIKEFKGTYEEFVEWNEKRKPNNTPQTTKEKDSLKNDAPLTNANASREQKKELQKLQKQFEHAERNLEELNQQKLVLEADMARSEIYANPAKWKELENAYQTLLQKIDILNEEYEQLFNKITNIELTS
jgi:ATP-binding cassette subfamily F protein 3